MALELRNRDIIGILQKETQLFLISSSKNKSGTLEKYAAG